MAPSVVDRTGQHRMDLPSAVTSWPAVGSYVPARQYRSGGGRPLAVGQALVLLPANHLALVGDGLDVVLVLVARLVQGMLGKNTTTRLNYGTIRKALFQFN